MKRLNPHPLHDGQIQPAPEPYQVDPLSEAVHSRGGTRVPPQVRALPTGATTRSFPAWRWGRSIDPPSNSGAPVIMSPSDLEPGRVPESPPRGSIGELRRRLKP
jgi:hypothetical protein